MFCCAHLLQKPGERMTTSARGCHRKLRRNILHTVVATALLAGTFTAVDQSINPAPANAAAPVVSISTPPVVASNGRSIKISFDEDTATATAPFTSYLVSVDGARCDHIRIAGAKS